MIEDLELGAAISAAISFCGNGCSIIVGVSHGIVTLEGDADTRERRQAVERVARGFAGVREVVNDITIRVAAAEEAESSEGHRASE